ncbi:hypothetical protein JCM5350_000349 [Sporobolomyces pararoseus]
MEFATSLLSSASTALAAAQKPTIFSTYTTDPSISPIQIGVWKITRAKHNSNNKQVSIWNCDKGSLVSNSGLGGASTSSRRDRDRDGDRLKYAVDTLKKEASSLSRLRHPCILEMAEPPTESRSTITFATEPVLSSLQQSLDVSTRRNKTRQEEEMELDEVEIQKGMSQLGKGLQFLHESAKLVHGNLTPEAVIINSKGDWKLSGFGLSTYLFDSEGVPAKWNFPNYDPSLPRSIQRDYDYIAPEYILDESSPAPANDLYSLGCILHSIHLRTGPPFANHNTLSTARSNIESSLSLLTSQWRKLPQETQQVLNSLITRYPNRRMTAKQFLESSYFEGVLVGTLRFLERDSFNSKTGDVQASFLKGLITVLPSFSSKVNRLKILPTLLELTVQSNLIPFLLPPILYIATQLPSQEFMKDVLPNVKPLFTVKEPVQAVVGLLDNLSVFKEKCTDVVFREEVMPLVYHALESDNPIVLEKALKIVPGLCETLDYTTVKQVLFPKVTTIFSKTTLLSVKVNTLICFHSMIKILDKFTLTEKLVPLLSKIKTKEPAVMISVLAVYEAMSTKCEVEAIATLILPQLWAMSIGPLLNVDQFSKFMTVIKSLSTRVETEHHQRLAELKRLEESSGGRQGAAANGIAGGSGLGVVNPAAAGVSDFEALVRGTTNGTTNGLGARGKQVDIFSDESPALTPTPTGGHNIFSSPPLPALPTSSPPFMSSSAFPSTSTHLPSLQPSRPSPAPRLSSASSTSSSSALPRSSLGARAVPSTSFNSSVFPSQSPSPSPAPQPQNSLRSFAPLQPQSRTAPSSASNSYPSTPSATSSTPNYNFSSLSISSSGLPPLQPTSSSIFPASTTSPPPQQQQSTQPIKWNVVPPLQPSSSSSSLPLSTSQPQQQQQQRSNFPPGYSSSSATLQPTVRNQGNGFATGGNWGDWKDLDPLK